MDLMTRWNPFVDFDDMSRRLSAVMGRVPRRKDGGKESMTVAEWEPLVDIVEDDKEYLIKADLPEVKKEDIKVSIQDDVLSLSGERTLVKEEKSRRFHRVERAYGSFARSFTLPDDADAGKVLAEFSDGVLKVHLPKTGKAKSRTVDVKIG